MNVLTQGRSEGQSSSKGKTISRGTVASFYLELRLRSWRGSTGTSKMLGHSLNNSMTLADLPQILSEAKREKHCL